MRSSPARIARSTGRRAPPAGQQREVEVHHRQRGQEVRLEDQRRRRRRRRGRRRRRARRRASSVTAGRARGRRLHRRGRVARPGPAACRARMTTSGDVEAGGDEGAQRRRPPAPGCRGRRGAAGGAAGRQRRLAAGEDPRRLAQRQAALGRRLCGRAQHQSRIWRLASLGWSSSSRSMQQHAVEVVELVLEHAAGRARRPRWRPRCRRGRGRRRATASGGRSPRTGRGPTGSPPRRPTRRRTR